MALLIVEGEGVTARHVRITAELVRIGRDPGCELVLASQFVSRQHAEVRADGEAFTLVDLGSRNGTILNGQRIEAHSPVPLRPGDRFRIEDFSVGFILEDAVAETLLRQDRAMDELFVDTEAMEVWIGDQRLNVRQARVLKLLAYMYSNRDRVCGEEELGNYIWSVEGETPPPGVALFDAGSLYQLIYLARRAVEQEPRKPRYLVNIPGLGYRLLERPALG